MKLSNFVLSALVLTLAVSAEAGEGLKSVVKSGEPGAVLLQMEVFGGQSGFMAGGKSVIVYQGGAVIYEEQAAQSESTTAVGIAVLSRHIMTQINSAIDELSGGPVQLVNPSASGCKDGPTIEYIAHKKGASVTFAANRSCKDLEPVANSGVAELKGLLSGLFNGVARLTRLGE